MRKISTAAALAAAKRGYQPIPIREREKIPGVGSWTRIRWTDLEDVEAQFDAWAEETPPATNVGVLLGAPSGNLVDIDIDHPRAMRLKDFFLPPTPAKSGRDGRAGSHYWYIAEEGTLPPSRQHLMQRTADGKRGPVSVELRSTGGQTVIPPSIHPSGEHYRWDGEPWGGSEGPLRIHGKKLAAQVALLGLGAVLLDAWPTKGTRHEAYLALAGGLLSYGDGVHPFWERNISPLIRALASATLDEDGPDAREHEVVGTTLAALRAGKRVVGLGSLVPILSEQHVQQIRVLAAEIEEAAGHVSRQAPNVDKLALDPDAARARLEEIASKPLDEREPLTERISTWEPLDIWPYLSGQVKPVQPTVLRRDDGQHLMYPGRVNMLYGNSESAKSWIALQVSNQVMDSGQVVVYLDFEDEPVNTLERLKALGAGTDTLRYNFKYIRPEDPIADMQRDHWGKHVSTGPGELAQEVFWKAIEEANPSLIVADGMTVLYGLHGLNTNDTSETDVIASWLKKLTRNGKSTVIVIDHTSKSPEKGTMPIGSQHKVSAVQGTLLQAWMIKQPMPGGLGEIELVVLKDRPGEVRRISQMLGGSNKAQVAAIVKMDSTQLGVTNMTIEAPPTAGQIAAGTTVNAGNSKAAQERDRRRTEELLVIDAFGDLSGTVLTKAEILSKDAVVGGWSDNRITNVLKRLQGLTDSKGHGLENGKAPWIKMLGVSKNAAYELIQDSGSADLTLIVDLSDAGTD